MGKALERALWRMYAPHKVKLAVSGCPRNCAESGIKDVGVIGVESGWEIYVAGNGGIKTEVAQFLVKVKTRRRGARVQRRLPAALSRGGLVSRAHRALRRARRARLREKARARRCRQAAARCGSGCSSRSTASPIRGTRWRRRASTRGSSRRWRWHEPMPTSRSPARRQWVPNTARAVPCSSRLRARRYPRARRARHRAARPSRRQRRACFAPPTIACSPCSTAARTRAGRCRRASCSATAWRARCTTGRSSLRTGEAVAPDAGCARRFRCNDRARHRVYVCAGLNCDGRDALDVPVLRRRLRRRDRARRRRHHRRARRSRPSGELRPAVHQGAHAASDRASRRRWRRGSRIR